MFFSNEKFLGSSAEPRVFRGGGKDSPGTGSSGAKERGSESKNQGLEISCGQDPHNGGLQMHLEFNDAYLKNNLFQIQFGALSRSRPRFNSASRSIQDFLHAAVLWLPTLKPG